MLIYVVPGRFVNSERIIERGVRKNFQSLNRAAARFDSCDTILLKSNIIFNNYLIRRWDAYIYTGAFRR